MTKLRCNISNENYFLCEKQKKRFWKIFVYFSAVQIRVFFSLMVLKEFNAGAELVGSYPTHNCCFRLFFFLDKNCIYLDTECLYGLMKQESFHMHTPTLLKRQEWVKRAQKMVLVMSRTTVNCVRSVKILLGHVKKLFSCPFSHYTVVLAHAVQLHTQISSGGQ